VGTSGVLVLFSDPGGDTVFVEQVHLVARELSDDLFVYEVEGTDGALETGQLYFEGFL
jgi:hypothetical protein